MKFSGKMYFKIILKVTKNQGFTFFLEDILLKKHREIQIDPSSHFKVKTKYQPLVYRLVALFFFWLFFNFAIIFHKLVFITGLFFFFTVSVIIGVLLLA